MRRPFAPIVIGVVAAATAASAIAFAVLRSQAADRRLTASDRELRDIAAQVRELQGRPSTETIVVKERSPSLAPAPPAAQVALVANASSAPAPSQRGKTREEVAQARKEFFEKTERDFAGELVDPVWAERMSESLRTAIQKLPEGLAEIASIDSKNTHARIAATFASAADYNRFAAGLFRGSKGPDGRIALPDIERGAVFVPSLGTGPDGKFRAVIYIDRKGS
jgi:hypothetical protein